MTNSFLLQIFTPLVLKWGQFCLPGDSWQDLETFLVVTTGAGKGGLLSKGQLLAIDNQEAFIYAERGDFIQK